MVGHDGWMGGSSVGSLLPSYVSIQSMEGKAKFYGSGKNRKEKKSIESVPGLAQLNSVRSSAPAFIALRRV